MRIVTSVESFTVYAEFAGILHIPPSWVGAQVYQSCDIWVDRAGKRFAVKL